MQSFKDTAQFLRNSPNTQKVFDTDRLAVGLSLVSNISQTYIFDAQAGLQEIFHPRSTIQSLGRI